MNRSDNVVFRSGGNKDDQGFFVKQMSNVNEGFSYIEIWKDNEGRLSLIIMSRVVGPKKQARKHRSNSKPNDSEMPLEFSVKEPNIEFRAYIYMFRTKDPNEGNSRRREQYIIIQNIFHSFEFLLTPFFSDIVIWINMQLTW